jgi:MFS family permease
MVARGLSMGAFQMQAVAVGWQVYALTGSALDLGLVGLAQFLPMLCLTLVAGHVADRADRRRIASICQAVEAACVLLLGVATVGHFVSRDLILATLVVLGAGRAFENPNTQSLTPSLVDAATLPRAIAFAASANQTAAICGPALGGFLYAVGTPVPYFVSAACFALASVLMRTLKLARPPARRERATWRSVFSGLGFIWRQKPILGSISLDLFATLLGGATALLPIFAHDILNVNALGMGFLRAGPAMGALFTSITLTRHPPRRHIGRVMFAGVFIYGVAMLGFGLSRSFWVSLVALAASGAADSFSVFVRNSLVQTRTPEHMLGRVSAVNALFIGTSAQIGEFESGVTAQLMGAVGSVVLGGVGTLVVCLLWMGLFPGLRKADTIQE